MNNWIVSLNRDGTDSMDLSALFADLQPDNELLHPDQIKDLLQKNDISLSSSRNLITFRRTEKQWRPLTVDLDTEFYFSMKPLHEPLAPVRIVYFLNGYINKGFHRLMTAQLKDLKRSRILDYNSASFYFVFSGTDAQAEQALRITKRLVPESILHFTHTKENAFEYPGIKKVWDLAQENREGYILYFHAKGLSHLSLFPFSRKRTRSEQIIFREVVFNWKKNILWLDHLTSATKAGLHCGGRGWAWYNFWIARSSYLYHLDEPVLTQRRHYYEDWLCRYNEGNAGTPDDRPFESYPDTLSQCLSIDTGTDVPESNLGTSLVPGSPRIQRIFKR